jgi:hypothetical protein
MMMQMAEREWRPKKKKEMLSVKELLRERCERNGTCAALLRTD